jgi:hypothetical protein
MAGLLMNWTLWLGDAYALDIGSPASEIAGGPWISRFDKRFLDGTMRQSR